MSQTLFTLMGKIAIDASGATSTINATIDASEDLAAMLGTVATKADSAGDKMNNRSRIGTAAVWLGNTLHTLTNKLGHLAVSVFKSGLDFNANMESYQRQFAALLQNEEQAQTLTAQIQELAKISPLGMEGLAKNAVQLLSSGTELTKIMPTLEMLGNLSLGDTTKMDYIVTAYTQIMNTGKLKAQEINQLINAGVPIIRLLTEYGGDKFADGSWYQDFLENPKDFVIAAEDVHKAMKAATEEGGDYYQYMLTMMDSYKGQLDRLGEEGREAMGKFMLPFNNVLSAKVFPKISELLGTFGTWAEENTESIGAFANALGDFAVWGLNSLIEGFKYLVEHGPELVETIRGIAESAGAFFQTVGSWFGLDEKVEPSSLEGKYAHWTKQQQDAAKVYLDETLGGRIPSYSSGTLEASGLTDEEITKFKTDIEDVIANYDLNVEILETWFADGTESELQSQLDGYGLTVPVTPVFGWIGNLFSGGTKEDGSHASGIDYVPRDGYVARLHLGEKVLPRHEADDYRRSNGSMDISRLENAINSLSDRVFGIMQQVAMNTAGSQIVCLETGAIVGQTVRQIDTELGNIATRKGRRN